MAKKYICDGCGKALKDNREFMIIKYNTFLISPPIGGGSLDRELHYCTDCFNKPINLTPMEIRNFERDLWL